VRPAVGDLGSFQLLYACKTIPSFPLAAALREPPRPHRMLLNLLANHRKENC